MGKKDTEKAVVKSLEQLSVQLEIDKLKQKIAELEKNQFHWK
jgi:hypothetical protein